ncbi:MAG: ribosome small subunit-dependent GTPase A [bacterium]|nr:ribosome small subunit-dependent GTPase A [bacterium]
MQTGIISRIYGAYYNLRPLPDLTEEISGQLRGRLRLESRSAPKKKSAGKSWNGGETMRERHLLIVGDHVRYSASDAAGRVQSKSGSGSKAPGKIKSGGTITIHSLEHRRNAVYRSTAGELHALGSNLDRAVVLMSLNQPRPRWGFLDRFLASCHAGGVPAQIVFTKPDLVEETERADLERMIALYRDGLGYPVTILDLLRQEPAGELDALVQAVASGVTLLAGHSGTGKSTLTNLLLGDKSVQKTGSISESSGKGRHTTTNSRLIMSDDRRMFLIDTPGVKEWGVQHLSPEEILESFPEIEPATRECRFGDCTHQPEQDGCAVHDLLDRSRDLYAEYFENFDAIESDPNVAVPPHSEECVHPERLRSLQAMLDSLEYNLKIRTGDFIKATGRARNGRIKPA